MSASSAPVGNPRRRSVIVLAALALLLALGGLGYWFSGMLGGKTAAAKKPPKITLLAPPPPPPPPPPPKFEKKPDPPKEQKEMKVEQPAPKQDTTPPSPELKMDGPAGNGPSAFGAGKITSEDLSKVGTGKPGGTGSAEKTGMFNPFTNYANLLKGELQRSLGKNANLKRRRYAVEVRVWITATGAASRFELVGSSGDSDTDEAINLAMAALPVFSQTPPNNMPQPIRLRISTGG